MKGSIKKKNKKTKKSYWIVLYLESVFFQRWNISCLPKLSATYIWRAIFVINLYSSKNVCIWISIEKKFKKKWSIYRIKTWVSKIKNVKGEIICDYLKVLVPAEPSIWVKGMWNASDQDNWPMHVALGDPQR